MRAKAFVLHQCGGEQRSGCEACGQFAREVRNVEQVIEAVERRPERRIPVAVEVTAVNVGERQARLSRIEQGDVGVSQSRQRTPVD